MSGQPALVTEAVVLRTVPYRDADLIVTLYTRACGKISAMARSARKSKKRFGNALSILTLSRAELRRRPGAEMWTLSSAEPLRGFAGLAADLAQFAHASYGTELVRELTAAEQPDEAVLDLLVELFASLEQRGASVAVLRAFELRLLALIGLAPVLDRCVGCDLDADAGLDEGGSFLDPQRGGVVCRACSAAARDRGAILTGTPRQTFNGAARSQLVRPLSGAARAFLVEAQRVDALADAPRESAGDAPTPVDSAVAAEARDAVLALILAHVGKPLRSLEFIAKLSGARRREP